MKNKIYEKYNKFILKKRSIWFHLIIGYLTIGIWAVIYFLFKKEYKNREIEKDNLEKLKAIEKKRLQEIEDKQFEENMYWKKIFDTKINPKVKKWDIINTCNMYYGIEKWDGYTKGEIRAYAEDNMFYDGQIIHEFTSNLDGKLEKLEDNIFNVFLYDYKSEDYQLIATTLNGDFEDIQERIDKSSSLDIKIKVYGGQIYEINQTSSGKSIVTEYEIPFEFGISFK